MTSLTPVLRVSEPTGPVTGGRWCCGRATEAGKILGPKRPTGSAVEWYPAGQEHAIDQLARPLESMSVGSLLSCLSPFRSLFRYRNDLFSIHLLRVLLRFSISFVIIIQLCLFFFSHASILWRCPSVFLIYFSLSYLLFISEMLFLVTSLDCLRLILYWSMTVFYFQD